MHYDLTLAGDYTAGCYSESEDKPTALSFMHKFRVEFGEPASDTMETAYYGVYLWKHAVEKAQSTDTKKVRAALPGLTIETPDRLLKIDPVSLHAWQAGQVSQVKLDAERRLNLEVVHRKPRPIEPLLYPVWQTREQWNDFRDMLYKEWGQNWESVP